VERSAALGSWRLEIPEPALAGLGYYLSRTQGFARYARSTLGYTLPPALLAR
jgi:hypothetical protein